MNAYCELVNAIITLACDDYRHYNKHFRKNLDLIQYIEARMEELRQASGEHSDELNDLRLLKNDIKFDQIKLQSKIEEIEIFLLSEYGTIIHGEMPVNAAYPINAARPARSERNPVHATRAVR